MQRVSARLGAGAEQVILSTNVAETSVTVPGVRYVVDSGYVKLRSHDSRLGSEALQVVPVSKAQARQRSGRAGACFCLLASTSSLSSALAPYCACTSCFWNLHQILSDCGPKFC